MDDELDDGQLGDALRARSGGDVGLTDARVVIAGRAATLRRRRVAAVGGGTMALFAVGALLLVPRVDDAEVPADDAVVPTVDTTTPDSTGPDTTVDDVIDDDLEDTAPVDPTTSLAPRPDEDDVAVAAPVTTPATTTIPPTRSTAPPAASTTAAPAPTTTVVTTTVATTTSVPDDSSTPPFTKTYSTAGGSATIDWDGSALTLLAVDPAPGYSGEVEEQSSDRIQVRFRGDDDTRVEIRASGGQIEELIG